MFKILDKVEYWLNTADEDIKVAKSLFNAKHHLQMGFFCHLIAEKALKAVISSVANETPPRIHDLKKLSKQGGIYECLSDEQLALLERLMPFQIEARYPEYKNVIAKTINTDSGKQILNETEEFLCWIKQRLEK